MKILTESLQQAERLYFKTGKLSQQYKEAILNITGGDIFTRLVSDIVFHFLMHRPKDIFDEGSVKMGKIFYELLKSYNKDLFPIPGNLMDYNQTDENPRHVLTLFEILQYRKDAVRAYKMFPSVAQRNMKYLNHEYSNQYDYKEIADNLSQILNYMKNIPDSKMEYSIKKIFSSKHNIKQAADVAEALSSQFNFAAEDLDKSEVLDRIQYVDAEVVQNTRNILVVKVNDIKSASQIGCIANWCFLYDGSYWESYAANGYLYMIFNFAKDTRDALFLMTYIPNTGEIYSSTNLPLSNFKIKDDYTYLTRLGVNLKALHTYDSQHFNNGYHSKEEENQLSEVRKIIRNKLLQEILRIN